MESLPKVVLIVLNWNGIEDTLECLDSLKQVDYGNLEIVVVDNGSTDGSVERLREAYPELPLLLNGVNLGFAGGNNVGIRYALARGADFVILLNNDTVADGRFVSELVSVALQNASIGFASARIYYYSRPEEIWFGGSTFNPWTGRAKDAAFGRPEREEFPTPFDIPLACGCAMMVSRQAVEAVGLLDERFFCYGEEIDWCLRARKAGFRGMMVPGAKVYHKVSASTGGAARGITMYYRIRNHLLTLGKNHPLRPWPFNALREGLVILLHLAALFKLGIRKGEGIRFLLWGVLDYHRGHFGELKP